ncbi:hypothetical protein J1614_007146 [Plenodomus biglobosus]|nr:hypothetical protein J1614_007146 [Plenodomus biglobosus]
MSHLASLHTYSKARGDKPAFLRSAETLYQHVIAIASSSFAVVHASSATPVYTFNNGTLKNNETDLDSEGDNFVTSDSIFRIISITKNLAMSSALVVENIFKSQSTSSSSSLTLGTPIRFLLPDFRLPDEDWKDGGSEITLRMLASHTAGIPRESYSTGFNMVLSTGRADAATIGAEWAGLSVQDVIDGLATSNLMFAPGQRAACKCSDGCYVVLQ